MQKILLISVLAATIAIPLLFARGGSLKQAVKRSVVATGVFCTLYWLGLLFVYPSLQKVDTKIMQQGSSAPTP